MGAVAFGSWRRALPVALNLCESSSATLHVITVMPGIDPGISLFSPDDANEKMLETATRDLRGFVKKNVPTEKQVNDIVWQGSIYREILNAAETANADLIVMASHKPNVTDYLLRANAAHVVRHFPRSVMALRG